MKRYNYQTHLESIRENGINFLSGKNSDLKTYLKQLKKVAFFIAMICFAQSAAAQSIAFTNVTYTPVCSGSNVTLTFFTTNGNGAPNRFTNSTVYTIYLSDAAGTNYTSQGTFSTTGVAYSTTNGGITGPITQTFTIPGGTPAGTGYQIALGSTSPTVNGSAGAGASAPFTVVLTAPLPGRPGGITGNIIVCDGATNVQYSVQPAANAVSYNWTVPVGVTIVSGAGTRIITVDFPTPYVAGSICVSSVNACGVVSASRCLTVNNISNYNPGRITGSRNVCLNTTGYIYQANSVNGATNYNWTLPAGMTISAGAGTRTITVDVGASLTPGPLCVSVDNFCGTSLVYCINVGLTTGAQPGGITGPAQVCANTPGVVFSVQPVTGATSYTWTLPAGYTLVSGATTRIITVDIGASPVTGDVCVTADFPCGPSLPRCKNVIYNAPVAGVVTGPTNLCAITTGVAYSTPVQPNIISYNWTFPTGITQASGGTTNSITVDVDPSLTSGDICVTLTDVCGTSIPSCLNVKDYSNVIPGGITGPNIVCQGATGLVFSVQQVEGAVSYIWSVPAGITITSGLNTGAITVDVDNTFTIGDIGVRAVSDCGTESRIRWNGYVTAVNPSLSGTIAASAPICRNTTVTFSVVAIPGVTDYVWTLPAGMTFTSGFPTNTNSVSLDISSTFAQGMVCVRGVSSCGVDGYSRCQTFNVIPDKPGLIAGPTGVCPGATGLSYSVGIASGAATYNWEIPAGWNITSGAGTNSITVDASANFIQGQIRVNSVSACGDNSGIRTLNVTHVPGATGAIIGSSAVCDGNTYVYAIDNVAGAASYSWTLPSGMSFTAGPPTNTNSISVDVDGTFTGGDVCVSASTTCGGPGTQSCLTVGTTPATPGAITGLTAVCQGATGIIYSIEAIAGISDYNWTIPGDMTIISGQGTTTLTVDIGAGFNSGLLCVEANNACGTAGATSCISISVTPSAPIAITASANFCAGSTETLSVELVSGASTYTWTVPAGLTIVNGQGSNTLTVLIDDTFVSGSVCVTAFTSCGEASIQYCEIINTSSTSTAPTNITSSQIICPGANVEFSVSNTVGAGSFNWSVPAGLTIVSGQGSPTLTVAADPGYLTGSVCVTASQGCGSSSTQLCETFNSTPGIPGGITAPTTVCENDPEVIFSVSEMVGVASYNWTVPAGMTILSGDGSNTITVSVGAGFTSGQVDVSASSACGLTGGTRSITVGSSLGIPGAMTGSTIACPGATGIVYSVPVVTGAVDYIWSLPGDFTITSGANTNAITADIGITFTSGQVSVSAVSECGIVSAARTISVSSTFGVPGVITAPAAVCQNSTGLIFSVPAVAGVTTYDWSVPAGFTITAGAGTNSITVDVDGTFTTGQICVALVSSCSIAGPQRCLTLSSLPGQPGGVTGQRTGVCDQTLQYSVQPATLATSYTWTAPAGASIASGQGTRIVQVTFSDTYTSGQLEVYSSNSCGNSATRLSPVITGAPAKPVSISGPASVCANQGGYSYNIAPVLGATSYNWSLPAGALITAGNGTTGIVVTWGINGGPITVSAQNDCGTSLLTQKTIAIICRMSKGSDPAMEMSVYPSPAINEFTVEYASETETTHLIELFDLNGKLLISKSNGSVTGNNQFIMDASTLQQGVYVVKLTDPSGKTSISRVIIQ